MRVRILTSGLWLAVLAFAGSGPDVLIISVDALRGDRLSCQGYTRNTSPHVDDLLARGVRFARTRTPEPLTAPALTSLLTSLYPHQHGATRNGVRSYPGLTSLPGILEVQGYETAAFVGNWTLKDKLCGLGTHFGVYDTVITKKRWFGLLMGEANASDITRHAADWLEARSPFRPFMLWIHYIEPHAPYLWHGDFADQLGYEDVSNPSRSQRYDSEVAFVDREIGHMVDIARSHSENLLIVFTADHGESLGEHNYWGHGRNLYDPSLIVPLGIVWEGPIDASVCQQDASLLDIAPTILGLMGAAQPETFRGRDWSPLLLGKKQKFPTRPTYLQAHKGAVHSQQESQRKRRKGLLQVGIIQGDFKQVYRVKNGRFQSFDLVKDPLEKAPNSANDLSPLLKSWLDEVIRCLEKAYDAQPPIELDEEDLQVLEGLGYIK